jgi:cyclic pyranopterin phosphate synthase
MNIDANATISADRSAMAASTRSIWRSAGNSIICTSAFGLVLAYLAKYWIRPRDGHSSWSGDPMAEQRDRRPVGERLTHFDDAGRARMVDVGAKDDTDRIGVATGRVRMSAETVHVIREGRAAKGDVLAVAQIAAIMGAKRTPDLIPMCHPLLLTRSDVRFELGDTEVFIEATVATKGPTGVEMEALTAVATAALTIYDMLKAIDRGMTIDEIRLERKSGGRSGTWQREAGYGP